VAYPKEKENDISHLATCIHQQTDHGMEREENGVVERVRINEVALNEKHKSHKLCKEDKEVGLPAFINICYINCFAGTKRSNILSILPLIQAT
jgi:hypothetical protein